MGLYQMSAHCNKITICIVCIRDPVEDFVEYYIEKLLIKQMITRAIVDKVR